MGSLLLTTAAVGNGSATANLWPWLIYAFLGGLGFLFALAALYYVIRTRKNAFSYVKGIVGGAAGSSALAALGTQIGGLSSISITWAEAAIITGIGFIVGVLFWGASAILAAYFLIVRPLRVRYGVGYSTRVLLALFTGLEPIGELLRGIARRTDTDEVWDEFCVAAIECHDSIIAESEYSLVDVVEIAAYAKPGSRLGLEPSLEILDEVLRPHIQRLAARLSRTSLNFTVWRIHTSDPVLEYLVSLPQDSSAKKDDLPIWKNNRTKADVATLAGRALIDNDYREVRAGTKAASRYEKRRLGVGYDAVGCMPIPCGDEGQPPWGVLCVESIEGTIPLDSEIVRMIMLHLSRVVASSGANLANRTIEDARIGVTVQGEAQ